MPPHVFAIAEASYHHMNSYKENQCIIISGESGAGKTEAAKRIMQYIAAVSGDSANSSIKEIKDMVLATNPLLESFGCAKTLRNNNSSRHGKYLEIQFNSQGQPVGAIITNYLLEKNRVVGQIENERNFHVFYQLTKGALPEYQESFGLQGPESYLYTSRSNCLDVEGIDDVNDFQDTLNAMNIIGLQKSEQDEIFKLLATVLWIGNLVFVEDDSGNAAIADGDVANFVAYLLEVDSEALSKALTSRIMETQRGGRRGSVYEVPLNVTQATAVRDALSKTIYERLFEWIVARVNVSLESRGGAEYTIGVLDIYGFEIFDDNNFEQMCINYVNEKLQQIFIELTLKAEQEEYVREQIQWTPIKFFNNKVVCDLIEEKRPPGVFAALNDACATAHADPSAADNSFVQRLGFLASNPHFESRGSKFLIRHYAGDVLYNVEGMTDKNKDALLKDLLELVTASTNQFISHTLFPERIDPNSKKRPPTAGDKIKASCNALVSKLMQCHPSYIRTIKPNDNRSSTEYDQKRVLHQVQYLGLCENIRVRRAGYAYRTVYDKFLERFYLLSPATGYAGDYVWNGDAKTGSFEIMKHNNIPADEWQMGTSKMFIRHPETIFALEHMRDRYWHNMATRIQRAWRGYVRHKHECARKIQRFWRQNKYNIGYLQMREYGHRILDGRKERRRYSLLSMRKFTGDYLDIKNGTGAITMIRDAIPFSHNEEVVFSMRGQTLVARAMRSSVPSPRTLVMTNQAIHVVMTTKKEQVLSMVDEKAIPLKSISAVSLSNLRDDWFVLHVDGAPEGDTILSCVFKTELLAHLLQRKNDVQVNIASEFPYKKKGGKMVTMKFVKDETATGDGVYKSHVVRIASGEPASSLSDPPCPVKARHVAATATRRTVTKKPQITRPATSNISRPPSNIQPSTSSGRQLPPPPPPAPAAPATPTLPTYKAIYPFQSDGDGEVSFEEGTVLEIVEKDDNGWWLARLDGKEGWVPNNYLEECVAPKPVPPPPARRPPPSAPLPSSTASTPSVPSSAPSVPSSTPNVPSNSKPPVAQRVSAAPVPVIPGLSPSPAARPTPPAPSKTTSSTITSQVSSSPIAVMPGVAAPLNANGVPPWKAQLEARKAAAAAGGGGNGTTPPPAPSSSSSTFSPPIPATRPVSTTSSAPTPPARPNSSSSPAPPPIANRRPPPVTAPKPVVPARPSNLNKPVIPARPGSSAVSNPSSAATSLADALRQRRQGSPGNE
ncbi:unnamed protein product [Absidia cylindrospora]